LKAERLEISRYCDFLKKYYTFLNKMNIFLRYGAVFRVAHATILACPDARGEFFDAGEAAAWSIHRL
jgi:hypothetical protein